MAKGDDLHERLMALAVCVTRISQRQGKQKPPSHIVNQLLRSGTSPLANYAEARSAESRRDFVHKLGVALKELNECLVWLQLLRRLDPGDETAGQVEKECSELCRIIAASIRTASGHSKKMTND